MENELSPRTRNDSEQQPRGVFRRGTGMLVFVMGLAIFGAALSATSFEWMPTILQEHQILAMVAAGLLLVLASKIWFGDSPDEILACVLDVAAFALDEVGRWIRFATIHLRQSSRRIRTRHHMAKPTTGY